MSAHQEKLTLTIEEARGLLGIGRSAAYEAARRGQIPIIKIGKRLLVSRVALDRLLARAGEESAAGADEAER